MKSILVLVNNGYQILMLSLIAHFLHLIRRIQKTEFMDLIFAGPKNCTSKSVPLTTSEIKFKKRNIQEIESAKKSKKTDYLESNPSCSYQLYPETDQESPISESASEENIQQSYVEMLATSSNNDSDPDYIADGLSDQQNRRELRTLAEACDR